MKSVGGINLLVSGPDGANLRIQSDTPEFMAIITCHDISGKRIINLWLLWSQPCNSLQRLGDEMVSQEEEGILPLFRKKILATIEELREYYDSFPKWRQSFDSLLNQSYPPPLPLQNGAKHKVG